jgi:rhodanese-related sulfurtransferase
MKALLPVVLVLAVLGGVTAAPADDPEVPEKYIKVDEAKALVDQNKRLVFVDVRPRQQYDEAHIRGAVSVPLTDLSQHLAEVPKQIPVVLY